jgi:hypothetical protein
LTTSKINVAMRGNSIVKPCQRCHLMLRCFW